MSVAAIPVNAGAKPIVQERRFFLFMSALLLTTAIVGFGPNTAAIVAGERPMPPTLIHIHAVLMFGWLMLLLTQAGLNMTGHRRLHQRLGMIAFVLVPVLVAVLVLVSFGGLWTRSEWPVSRYNVLLLQCRSIVVFPLLTFSALVARRSSPGTHKRLMIIATVVLLDAAIARMRWLPGAGGGRSVYEFNSAYQLLLLAPIVVYDINSLGRVHRASLVGIGLFAITAAIVHVLWGSEWLIVGAPTLLGIGP